MTGGSSERDERTRHVFTVDLEEYFQVHAFKGYISRHEWEHLPPRAHRSSLEIADFLEHHGIRATFFTLGWVADRNPDLIRKLAERGHEIASHGWSHRRITELTREEFRQEVRDTKRLLEDLAGQEVNGYRAPSYSLVPGTEWALEILVEEGYRYDSSIFPIRRGGYGYPGAEREPHVVETPAGPIREFPLATLQFAGLTLPAAGGAYFRHLPYALVRTAFRRLGDQGVPGVFYIHSWEMDEWQPRLPVPWLTQMRHYKGVERAMERAERLVEEFRFVPFVDHPAITQTSDARDGGTVIGQDSPDAVSHAS